MRTCGKRGAHTKSTSESVDPRWSISNSRLMSPTVDAALGCQAGQGEEQVQGTKDGRGVSRLRRGACPRMIEPSVHAHVRRRARAPRARAATRRSARALALCCRWEEGEHGGVDWTQLGPIRRPPCYTPPPNGGEDVGQAGCSRHVTLRLFFAGSAAAPGILRMTSFGIEPSPLTVNLLARSSYSSRSTK